MPKRQTTPPDHLEMLSLAHLGIFLVAATWMLGGSPPWAKAILSQWGSLSALLTLVAVVRHWKSGRKHLRPLLWLWPFLLFNCLVLLSCRTPSYREIHFGSSVLLIQIPRPAWPPNTAVPAESLQGLWLFDAIYLSCFNLLLIIRQRRTIRGLLLFAALNALVLSVFGTLQHFSDAKGPFFNMAPTRQNFFFASFIYHNHWGAFALLMTALSLGLMWHYAQRGGSRNFIRTPAFAGLVAVLFLAATEPLSASRSCTGLIAFLLLGAFLQWLGRLVRQRRELHESIAVPVVGTCAAGTAAVAGIWYVAAADIASRAALTREQLVDTHASGGISFEAVRLFLGSRFTVYYDTWRMAKDRIWFGWGMGSFIHVFLNYNTQGINPVDHLRTYYSEAHNDWLQSLAEHGLVGSALLGLCALAPLLGCWRRELGRILPLYLLAGCGLILAYAWFEFPFGNTAVVLVWWLLFFAALQYSRLSSAVLSAEPPRQP